ncbi:MAG: Crp/Fnr family transcriptional regulator [Desulfosoma sp.]|uniref:Crp/Fnr family transcriptional regulator n=1 Tax=Desulfosoma sp. TaxID=2603217 RepID=UPI00404A9202
MITVEQLKSCRFFLVFSDEELEKIAQVTQNKSLKKGNVVYRNGETAGHFFIVGKGLVSLREFQPEDTVGIAFETRGPGKIFGVASLMPSKTYTLTAVCQEDTELFVEYLSQHHDQAGRAHRSAQRCSRGRHLCHEPSAARARSISHRVAKGRDSLSRLAALRQFQA